MHQLLHATKLKKFILFLSVISVAVSITAFIFVSSDKELWFYRKSGELEGTEEELEVLPETPSLLINTKTCKIPDFPPWSAAARNLLELRCGPFFKGEPKCAEKHRHSWSYIGNSHLHFNLTALKASGYSWNSIRCCYRQILRVEQSLPTSDMNADKVIRYSSQCHPIKAPVQHIDADFIRLHCISTSLPTFGDVVSREFFAIAKPDLKASIKMDQWSSADKIRSPAVPNVIILGVDTISRLNGRRNFNETLEVLRSSGAVEMKGYTKTGGNTLPNTAGFLGGYTLGEMTRFCYKNRSLPMDPCPFLWKAFSKAGYLTAYLEDTALNSAFNFLKKGFVQKPTDFYLRPLMLAYFRHQPRPLEKYLRCLGSRQTEDFILRYLEDILKMAEPSGIPLFAHVWLGSLGHECGTSPKWADHIFAQFVTKLTTKFANTVVIFLSDHGETYAEFRETIQGWYEDNLPMCWIHLPAHLRQKFPEWKTALEINSLRLTSHFDLYKTLVQILHQFDPQKLAQETYQRLPGQRGQSLFEPVPESRTCQAAGIPDGYCVCSEPANVEISLPEIQNGAKLAFAHIYNMLPLEVCETPIFREIKRAKSFQHPEGYTVYIITFSTNPGDFVFEVTVKQDPEKGNVLEIANEILRVNKMSRKADCVGEALLEKYCYCK